MTEFYEKFKIGKLLQVNISSRNKTVSQYYNRMFYGTMVAIALIVIDFALSFILR